MTIHQNLVEKHFGNTFSEFPIQTWSIPTNLNLTQLSSQNAILVGDAAGLCDVLFGHGIDTAIISAQQAVKSIAFWISGNVKHTLDEAYAFNLKQNLSEALNASEEIYSVLETSKNISVLKNYVNK